MRCSINRYLSFSAHFEFVIGQEPSRLQSVNSNPSSTASQLPNRPTEHNKQIPADNTRARRQVKGAVRVEPSAESNVRSIPRERAKSQRQSAAQLGWPFERGEQCRTASIASSNQRVGSEDQSFRGKVSPFCLFSSRFDSAF